METKHLKYRNLLILGWVQLLQVVVLMGVFALLSGAVDSDFGRFAKDPGVGGMHILIIVTTLYIFMPILISLVDHVFIRWLQFGILIFFFLFFLAHQLTHMIVDKHQLNMFHFFDFAHHVITLGMCVVSFLWAKCKENGPSKENRETQQYSESLPMGAEA